MPRQRFHPTKLPLLDRIARGQTVTLLDKPKENLWYPRLYNASRRIKVSKGLPPSLIGKLRRNPDLLLEGNEPPFLQRLEQPTLRWSRGQWRRSSGELANRPSDDVLDFMDNVKLLPREKLRLLRSPSRYFSFPANVPNHARKQINL